MTTEQVVHDNDFCQECGSRWESQKHQDDCLSNIAYHRSRRNAYRSHVQMIASGYEWTCPRCDRLYCTIETCETVECPACGTRYDVADSIHADGKGHKVGSEEWERFHSVEG